MFRVVVAAVAWVALMTPALGQEPPRAQGVVVVGKEPPTANVTLPSATGDASGTRADPNKLRQELAELEKSIKYAEEKFKLGEEVSKDWKAMADRIERILGSHNDQAAACEVAKMNLKKRIDEAVPEDFLRDLRKHAGQCDDARKRYRTMLSSLETEVARMTGSINGVLSNMEDLKNKQTEELRRKNTLQQLMGTGIKSLSGKIDNFKGFQGH